jgi:membrane glycosyltransferase
MQDRLTALGAPPPDAALAGRRILFASLVVATIAAILALAAAAAPPHSLAADVFLALFAVTLPWSVVGFWNAAIGLIIMRGCRDPVATVNPMAARIRGDEPVTASTAILVCVRNERPQTVTRNLAPLLEGLAEAGFAPLFRVYILSDSADPGIISAELGCFAAFAEQWRAIIPVIYRRRDANTGYKAGNIRDFCERWGQAHEFALALDADSFMPAEAALRLLRIMQANPRLGILQTLVIGLPSVSAFARVFQFGMRLGMRSYTLGAAWWQGDCGPYWGHNAMLRLQPFIAHCRMPALPGGGPLGGAVLSHDQVEAALMRRAGYEVRVLPTEGVSWEENPPTLLEFIRRDLRWCHGNMQYWRLLGLPDLKPVSRFQLVFAILMYMGSPAWMAMMAVGAAAIATAERADGPAVEIGSGAGAALLAVMMLMVFAPKIASALDVLLRPAARAAYGGSVQFALNVAGETLFSLLLSPIMALTHTVFLFRLLVLRRGGAWESQTRESHGVPWLLALARLWPHTLAGILLIGLVLAKAPHHLGLALMGAAGLALSAPFTVATSWPRLGRLVARLGVGRIPEEIVPPAALLAMGLPALEPGAGRARRAAGPGR